MVNIHYMEVKKHGNAKIINMFQVEWDEGSEVMKEIRYRDTEASKNAHRKED